MFRKLDLIWEIPAVASSKQGSPRSGVSTPYNLMRSSSPSVVLQQMKVSPSITLLTEKVGQWKQQSATWQSGAWLGGVGVRTCIVKGKDVPAAEGASTVVQRPGRASRTL